MTPLSVAAFPKTYTPLTSPPPLLFGARPFGFYGPPPLRLERLTKGIIEEVPAPAPSPLGLDILPLGLEIRKARLVHHADELGIAAKGKPREEVDQAVGVARNEVDRPLEDRGDRLFHVFPPLLGGPLIVDQRSGQEPHPHPLRASRDGIEIRPEGLSPNLPPPLEARR